MEFKIPDSFDNALKNVSDKPTITLGDVFNGILNSSRWVNKKIVDGEITRISREAYLERLNKEIHNHFDNIPLDKLTDHPNTQLIMGALNDSQYCLETDELRAMFAKLIATSLNKDFIQDVHPSFSNIIRQLSPFDARILSILSMDRWNNKPIVNYQADIFTVGESGKWGLGGQSIFVKNAFLYDEPDHFQEQKDFQAGTESLEILSMLGLINITYDGQQVDDCEYEGYLKTGLYKKFDEKYNRGSSPEGKEKYKFYLQYGILKLTPMGRRFVRVCIP